MVSEGLNSVETDWVDVDEFVQHKVSEGLNSVETLLPDDHKQSRSMVSEGLNSVETLLLYLSRPFYPQFQKDLIVWKLFPIGRIREVVTGFRRT